MTDVVASRVITEYEARDRSAAVFRRARGDLKALGDEADRTERKLKDVDKALDGSYRDSSGRLRDARGRYLPMGGSAPEGSSAAPTAAAAASAARGRRGNWGTRGTAGGMLGAMGLSRMGVAAGGGLAAVGVVAGASAMAARYWLQEERHQTQMITLVGLEREEVDRLADSYGRLIGRREDLAAAAFQFTSAGQRGATAEQSVEWASKLGKLGVGDLQSVAGMMSSSMHATGRDAQAVSDLIIETARVGRFKSLPALAGAWGEGLASATSFGVDPEQFAAWMATASLSDIRPDRAKTAFRTGVTQLYNMNPDMEKKWGAFGYTQESVRVGMEADFLGFLEEAKNKMGPEFGSAIPLEVSGVLNAILANTGELHRVRDALLPGSAGEAADAWKQYMESEGGRWAKVGDKFGDAVSTFGSWVSALALPFAEGVAETFSPSGLTPTEAKEYLDLLEQGESKSWWQFWKAPVNTGDQDTFRGYKIDDIMRVASGGSFAGSGRGAPSARGAQEKETGFEAADLAYMTSVMDSAASKFAAAVSEFKGAVDADMADAMLTPAGMQAYTGLQAENEAIIARLQKQGLDDWILASQIQGDVTEDNSRLRSLEEHVGLVGVDKFERAATAAHLANRKQDELRGTQWTAENVNITNIYEIASVAATAEELAIANNDSIRDGFRWGRDVL